MVKDYIELKRNEKFENKIMITCDFHNAKYEFEQGKIIKNIISVSIGTGTWL